MQHVAINGRILPEGEACISPLDRGFLYGDGLFETLKAEAGRVHFLDLHLERLRTAARCLRIPFPEEQDLGATIRALLAKNRIRGVASVKICLTRGRHDGRLSLASASAPTLVVLAQPGRPVPPARWEEGLDLGVERKLLQNRTSPLCGMKSLNYLAHLWARTRAEEAGLDDAILLNGHGEVCETTTANLFFFRDGRLETPALACGLLPGVLRSALTACMEAAGAPVREVRLTADGLEACEEIFVTNSLVEILPVGRVDGRRFPARDRTRAVRETFAAYRDARHAPGG